MIEHLHYHRNEYLSAILSAAVERLKRKLTGLNICDLGVDDYYAKRFLQPKLFSIDSQLSKYTYHIFWAVSLGATHDTPLEDIVFLDHGGGTGMLGLLAKEAGIGTVIYNDIDSKFLDIARSVGATIGVSHNHYVLGDIDELIAYLSSCSIECNAIASYDVIEHIYDMDGFLRKISSLSNGRIGLIMSSGANMFNLRYVVSVLPKQKKEEKKWSKIREKIICECASNIGKEGIKSLVSSSRGMIKEETAQLVKVYLTTGSIPKKQHRTNCFDPFGTNTCDPITGWWAEHFLNPFCLPAILKERGFESQIWVGNYHGRPKPVARVLNTFLRFSGIFSLPIAPYYSLVGLKRL